MKALESEIGVSLLYRTNKGIELTEQGKLYWAYATEVWLSHQKMEEELRALSFKGSTVRLSLGVVDAFTTTFLPPFLIDFKRRHPEIDLRCFPMTAEEISRQLEKGSLDCALFMSFDGPGEKDWMLGSVSLEYVARCRNYCWVSTRSHLASQREMSLHQFAQNPVALRESVDLGFFEIVNAEEKVELIDFPLVTEPHMIAQLVMNNLAVCPDVKIGSKDLTMQRLFDGLPVKAIPIRMPQSARFDAYFAHRFRGVKKVEEDLRQVKIFMDDLMRYAGVEITWCKTT